MTDTNTHSVALKKLRNAEYQRKYRAKLTEQQLITLNSNKASTNRNRYNTDPNYKFNKNLYNKNKAKNDRNKAKLYDSIIDSTLTPTDIIQPPTDQTQT
jgi:CRISPR/Cas system-associated endonuclease/helicase Cas3